MASKTVNAWLAMETDGEVVYLEITDNNNCTQYKISTNVLERLIPALRLPPTKFSLYSYTIPNGEEPEPETDNYTEDSPF